MYSPLHYQFFFDVNFTADMIDGFQIFLHCGLFEEFSSEKVTQDVNILGGGRLSRDSMKRFSGSITLKLPKKLSTFKTKKKYYFEFSMKTSTEDVILKVHSPTFKIFSRKPKRKSQSGKRSESKKKRQKVERELTKNKDEMDFDLFKQKFEELISLKQSLQEQEQKKCSSFLMKYVIEQEVTDAFPPIGFSPLCDKSIEDFGLGHSFPYPYDFSDESDQSYCSDFVALDGSDDFTSLFA